MASLFLLLLMFLFTSLELGSCFTLYTGKQATQSDISLLSGAPEQSPTNNVIENENKDNANPNKGSADPPVITGVIAPLTYRGPYPCVGLNFHNLKTSLDFMVDTGANVNSLDADLVTMYDLERLEGVPKPLATAGMGGSFSLGDFYIIGDCSLADIPPEQSHMIFMRNLTAAALPYGTPAGAAGLLGSSFVSSLAGVEFDWHGTDGDPPTFVFYFGSELPGGCTKDMVRVPLQEFMQLFTVTIEINGVELPALLDTGSPVTIISQAAAERAGITPVSETENNAKINSNSKRQSIGDTHLTMGGVDGRPMRVHRSELPIEIQLGGLSLKEGPVYIGNVPALSLLQSLSSMNNGQEGEEAPVAILGLDSLRGAYRMILRTGTQPCEMWLEELDDTKTIYVSPQE